MKEQKKEMSIVKKMMIALVGGLAVGIACLFLREYLVDSGNEGVWNVINMLLFQDITAADGVSAIGIFYIIGQLFMRGLQLAIVTAGYLLPEPGHVQYLEFHEAWKNRGEDPDRIFLLLCVRRVFRQSGGVRCEISGGL